MSDRVLIADSNRDRGKSIAEACAARDIACDLVVQGPEALETALADRPCAVVLELLWGSDRGRESNHVERFFALLPLSTVSADTFLFFFSLMVGGSYVR